jgi:hypothetical protein
MCVAEGCFGGGAEGFGADRLIEKSLLSFW